MQGPGLISEAIQLIITGSNGGLFVYDSNGNLRTSIVGQTEPDPIQGITCQQGVATYNGFGAVVNLLSTATNKAAFFQYLDHNTGVQGGNILTISSMSGTDPVTGAPYSAGMTGIDQIFGDTLNVVGANIQFGQVPYTRDGQVIAGSIGTGGNLQPVIIVNSPEQTTASHLQLVLAGASTSASRAAQLIAGIVSGTAALSSLSLATFELQGSLALTASTLPSAVSTVFQIAVVGGILTGVTGTGFSGSIPLTQTDATSFTVTAITATQASKAWSIPAGDSNAGTFYRLTVMVNGTEGTTAQNLNWGLGLNGTQLAAGQMSASPASAVFHGKCVIEFHVKTTGAAGTADWELWASKGTTATPADVHNTAAGTAGGGQAFNTTVANTLQLMLSWASATGAPTVTSYASIFERVGP